MQFTDSHCHLDFPELEQQLPTLINVCQQQGIHRIIVPSVEPNNWQKVLELTDLTTSEFTVLAATGIHPWYIQPLDGNALDQLEQFVHQHQHQLCAIGETGIDGTIAQQQDNLLQQKHFFEYQIDLANRYQLPLIIHHRKSHLETVHHLKQVKPDYGGVIHGFSGSYQQAKAYLDLGLKLGIGGTISYERAKKTINTVKRLPITSIVLETDAPAMPLSGYQGQANSPLRLIDIFTLLSNIRTEPAPELAKQLELNIEELFTGCYSKSLSGEAT
ncbi:TatD family hydrolase [Thalassotalea atypica]|uniref:TatD family hydrolase n=1 Tax=Thalassotalea atypica TaxID=2054316 RepID=UPI002572CEDB|nr:TatD family hydrolase [Thalassotalea atypica]